MAVVIPDLRRIAATPRCKCAQRIYASDHSKPQRILVRPANFISYVKLARVTELRSYACRYALVDEWHCDYLF